MSQPSRLCNAVLLCGHLCPSPNHPSLPCPPCRLPCLQSCHHRTCPNPCFMPCDPCLLPCTTHCPHFDQCPFICAAPCAASVCNRRCEQLLSCGHRCPSLCGQPCPSSDYCNVCRTGPYLDVLVDVVNLSRYADYNDLDRDPILVLPCTHFFTVSSLDGLFQISNGLEHSYVTPPGCPACRQPIRGLTRYLPIQKVVDLRLLECKYQLTLIGKAEDLMQQAKEAEQLFRGSVMTGCFGFFFPVHRRVAKDAQAKFDSAFTKLFNMFTQISHGPMRITNDLLPEPAKLTPQEQRVGVFHVQSFMRMAYFCLPHVRAVANTDRAYCMIHSILLKAIHLTDQNSSFRSGAEARLLLVRAFLVDRRVANLIYSQRRAYWWQQEVEAVTMCDWVINSTSPAVSSAMKNDAKNWKKAIRNKEIVMVKQAATHSPQSRGGTWLSCRRGHQYLVGGCGTPQEGGRCVECGLQIGLYRGMGDT